MGPVSGSRIASRGWARCCVVMALLAGTAFGVQETTAAPITENAVVERARFASGELSISPDGLSLAYVSVHPTVAANRNVWSLMVKSLKPHSDSSGNGRTVYSVRSTAFVSNVVEHYLNSPISNVKWLSDGRSIIFKRQLRADSDAAEICVLDVPSGSLQTLFSFPGAIVEFSVSADGNTAALYLVHPQDARRKTEMEENGFSVDKELFQTQQRSRSWQKPLRQVVVVSKLLSRKPIVSVVEEHQDELVRASAYIPNLSISPDGQHLVYTRLLSAVPNGWIDAKSRRPTHPTASFSRPADYGLNQALTEYDVRDGTKRVAFDHPDASVQAVTWSDDSDRFVVRGPRPLSGRPIDASTQGGDTPGLYAVKATDLIPTEIVPEDGATSAWDALRSQNFGEILAWTSHGAELTLRVGPTAIQTLSLRNNAWRVGSVVLLPMPEASYWYGELRVGGGVVVGALENSSTPPDIYYWRSSAELSGPTRLTELNPQLKGMVFGPVEKIRWKNKYGAESVGYLILPSDFDARRRYPAVIMLKDWRDMFIMDGQWYTTAFPAQTLASHGFVILLAAAPSRAQQPKVGPGVMGYNYNELAMVESAIELLDQRKLVDLDRVGIAGFSVTSWQTQFILTNSKFPFAAAAMADGWNLNYVSYATQNLHGTPQGYDMGFAFDHLYGGPPFGKTMKNWLDYAPAFNTAKVTSPVLTEACGPATGGISPAALEWFTALHKLGKPVELYNYPDGQHMLQTPKERLASLRLNVDWFRFWLQGHAGDPPPYDSNRFVRWTKLREQHDKNRAAGAAGKDPVEEYQRELRAQGLLPSPETIH
jgi:dipeptidyl aminopeptidase/acylaminoacyl peptidase